MHTRAHTHMAAHVAAGRSLSCAKVGCLSAACVLGSGLRFQIKVKDPALRSVSTWEAEPTLTLTTPLSAAAAAVPTAALRELL